jgi:hypothetical protein
LIGKISTFYYFNIHHGEEVGVNSIVLKSLVDLLVVCKSKFYQGVSAKLNSEIPASAI